MMGYLWKSADDRTEVSLGYLLDENECETGVAVLEIVAPVRNNYSSAYNALMNNMQKARELVFGWMPVVDLSSVPLEAGIKMPLETGRYQKQPCINHFLIFEEMTHRNRYVYVGVPKKDFRRENMQWGDTLAIAAPTRRLGNETITADEDKAGTAGESDRIQEHTGRQTTITK